MAPSMPRPAAFAMRVVRPRPSPIGKSMARPGKRRSGNDGRMTPCRGLSPHRQGTLQMTIEDRIVSDEIAGRERDDQRSRQWRLAVASVGLAWVCLLLLLMP